MKQFKNFRKKKDVRILKEVSLYEGFFTLKQYQLKHRLFSGHWSSVITREVLERQQVAAALPYDPILDRIVLIQQFRIGALASDCPWLIEIVAGVREAENSMEEVIRREIQEESGLTPKRLHKLFDYWVSPGGSNEFLTLFCAEVDAKYSGGIHGLEDDTEDIFVYTVSCEEAFSMLTEGKFQNAITIMALQWLQLHKEELRAIWMS